MKKVIRTIFPLLLCFALLINLSAATTGESALLSGALTLHDGWLCLSIDLAKASGITNGQVQLSYDATEMELVRISGSELWDTQSVNSGTATVMFANHEAQSNGGTLLTAIFRPLTEAESYSATATALLRKDLETAEEVTLSFTSEAVSCNGKDCPSAAYKDLNTGAWYHPYTDYVIASGLMRGVGSNSFAPDATVTRAMIVQVLYNMSAQPAGSATSSFADVSANDWYAPAIAWAERVGIAKGITADRFMPNEPVTRQQAATFLYRYYVEYLGGEAVEAGNLSGYADASKVDAYALEAMTWANASGIITGISATQLDPQGHTLRCQLAKMLTVMDGIG